MDRSENVEFPRTDPDTQSSAERKDESRDHPSAPAPSSRTEQLTVDLVVEDTPSFDIRSCPECDESNTNISGASTFGCEVCGRILSWEDAKSSATESLNPDSVDTLVRALIAGNDTDAQFATKATEDARKADQVASLSDEPVIRAPSISVPLGVPSTFQTSQGRHCERDTSPQLEEHEQEGSEDIQHPETTDFASTKTFPALGAPQRYGSFTESTVVHPHESHSQRGPRIRWNDPYSYHRPMQMGPVPPGTHITPKLQRSINSLDAALEAGRVQDARNQALGAHNREIESFTPWQRFVWRMQLKPCWEAQEGCCYKGHPSTEDGTGHGHADGCCEMCGWRDCYCNFGSQHCGADGCCEGYGCVRCCGWTCGFWNLCDGWFDPDGCCDGCGCMSCCGLKHGTWKVLEKWFGSLPKKEEGEKDSEVGRGPETKRFSWASGDDMLSSSRGRSSRRSSAFGARMDEADES
ncbi:hypothetical protein EK21DRAFT_91419 [Setomelanomma holmii]|uniref:Uncharacterized protein n=1 Tax=Setomelanomma holmii TaxID=210430 RepID=A0A9P4H4S1_9PLEO|nr:hypothetical protein EK21DRAFT_91419 [Setomelanomma holmii]